MALNGLFCADVPLRNYSLTHLCLPELLVFFPLVKVSRLSLASIIYFVLVCFMLVLNACTDGFRMKTWKRKKMKLRRFVFCLLLMWMRQVSAQSISSLLWMTRFGPWLIRPVFIIVHDSEEVPWHQTSQLLFNVCVCVYGMVVRWNVIYSQIRCLVSQAVAAQLVFACNLCYYFV